MAKEIFTIGHSTRPLGEFVELLKEYGIEQIVDVRTIPKSRYNPQFNSDFLKNSLSKFGIKYLHLEKLGGLRKTKRDSVNLGWENLSFRGFADYMQTEGFEEGLKELISISGNLKTAIICAEAVPWRCHRSLIADALVKKDWNVINIMSRTSATEHKLTSFLKIKSGKLIYPNLNNNLINDKNNLKR